MKKSATILIFFLIYGVVVHADSFETRLQSIFARPEFRHSIFGIEFYSLDRKKPVYVRNENLFFIPASTTKLVTCGSALELFGPDYVFHTNVYRTGEIDQDGILNGDLVLVASGDPNLSGRITKDGKLLFENEDHSYGGSESHGIGDPAAVLREFADQIAAKRIMRITGRVLVDDTLFPAGEKELGTGVVISPIVVNDNLVDIIVEPGEKEGAPAILKVSPQTSYLTLINKITTVNPDGLSKIDIASDIENSDGSRTVTLTGWVSSGDPVGMDSYAVPDPKRYAQILFAEVLRERGIIANPALKEDRTDFKALKSAYTAENLVAEHVSPPMTEMIKVILKVSQNLHASTMPYLLSSLIAKKEAPQAGFDLIHDFLSKNVADISGASQNDGAGGSAHFTPDFMVHYLEAMTHQKAFASYYDALPVLGRDGTLFDIQVHSPAAGHVHAKTGTFGDGDMLNHGVMVTAKGLAGYVTTQKGHRLAFAIYINNVVVSDKPNAIRDIVGQAVGEIAAAAYDGL
jgi:PBP4 family serine-type D-alanyl-D-alanine carboxypeptidase